MQLVDILDWQADNGKDMSNPLPQAYELTGVTGKMITSLLTEEDVSIAVQSLACMLKDSIPNSAGAGSGASIIDANGRGESVGATDKFVLKADKLQYRLGQGPCLSAWKEQRPIIVEDIRKQTRWPEWTAAVADLSLRSVISTPLTLGRRQIGAMKVYSPQPSTFDEGSVFLIEQLARPAAVLLAHARDRKAATRMNKELAQALANRDMISTAQGILIERMNLNQQEALDVLLARSRGESTPLHEVARHILQETIPE